VPPAPQTRAPREDRRREPAGAAAAAGVNSGLRLQFPLHVGPPLLSFGRGPLSSAPGETHKWSANGVADYSRQT
jgi:hypothetical protein